LFEPLTGQLDIILVRSLALLLKGMENVNGVGQFCDIEHSPLTKYMDSDFFHSGAYGLHSFPVSWFKPVLDCAKFKTCDMAGFFRKAPEVVKARSDEL
jgi:hypothetical protein